MGISLWSLMDEGNESMREQGDLNNIPRDERFPFSVLSMRELITPQYQAGEVGLPSATKQWENWVRQHRTWETRGGDQERDRTELQPRNSKQLVASLVELTVSENSYEWQQVRAVGSGHSHSNAPAPPETYIELDPGEPGDAKKKGLNDVLEHNGWLKSDAELEAIAEREREGEGGSDASFQNPLTGSPLEPVLDREHLKRVESGIILRRLNRHILHPDGYALSNMGSFDGQTIAGAVNTSTHGTGIGLPSISDSVKSVEIATVPRSKRDDPIVKLYRIEPSNGITDRKAFEADTADHNMELIQDDELFHSVVVGYGCMGVVYAYTLQVVDNYWLKEETELLAWSSLKQQLGRSRQSVKQFLTKDGTRHCQILLNTAAEQVPSNKIKEHEDHGVGQHEAHRDPVCLVTRHKVTDNPPKTTTRSNNTVSKPSDGWVNATKDQRWPPERLARPFRDAAKAVQNFYPLDEYPGKARQMHNKFFHPQYRKDPFVGGMHKTVWYVALRRIRDRGDENTSRYFHPPPPPAAITTEVGVPAADVVEAVDAFRHRVRNVVLRGSDVEEGQVFFPVPMGIRFTAASDHYLSPEHGRETAMVELPIPVASSGFVDIVIHDIIEPALTDVEQHVRETKKHLHPRPHMGKHNTVTAEWLNENYELFDATGTDNDVGWIQAYNRFNPFETFDNKFTAQLGLDDYYPHPAENQDITQETERDEQVTEETETEAPSDDSTEATRTGDTSGEITEAVGPGLGFLAGLAGVGTGAWVLTQQRDRGDATQSHAGETSTAPSESSTDDDAPDDAE